MPPPAVVDNPAEKAVTSQRAKQEEWKQLDLPGSLSCTYIEDETQKNVTASKRVYRFLWAVEDDPFNARAEVTMQRHHYIKPTRFVPFPAHWAGAARAARRLREFDNSEWGARCACLGAAMPIAVNPHVEDMCGATALLPSVSGRSRSVALCRRSSHSEHAWWCVETDDESPVVLDSGALEMLDLSATRAVSSSKKRKASALSPKEGKRMSPEVAAALGALGHWREAQRVGDGNLVEFHECLESNPYEWVNMAGRRQKNVFLIFDWSGARNGRVEASHCLSACSIHNFVSHARRPSVPKALRQEPQFADIQARLRAVGRETTYIVSRIQARLRARQTAVG